MNDTLDLIRRNAYARAKDEDKDFIKGTRWLLLMNGESLKDSEKAQAKLREALQMNMPLMKAYYLKDGLHEIWNRAPKPEAEVLINEWIAQAKAPFLRTIKSYNGHYRKQIFNILTINKLTLYKMFRRNNKTREYQAPSALVTQMALESNFCQTVRFNIQVNDLENMNDPDDPTKGFGEASEEVLYFES